MPAAAVIPAPVAYIKVAAVKKLVVGVRSPNRNIIGSAVTMSYEHDHDSCDYQGEMDTLEASVPWDVRLCFKAAAC